MFSINRVHSPSGKHVMTQFTIIEVFGWALRLYPHSTPPKNPKNYRNE